MTSLPDDSPNVESTFRKEDWPFYWITRSSARYFMAMEKRLKPIGLDVARWRVLMSLYEDQHLSVSDIAEVCIFKLNTATKIIQRMVADGLVTTRSRPTDGRVTEVTLTEAGHRQRRAARAIADEVYATVFAKMNAADRQMLIQLNERVFRALDDV